MKPTHQRNFQPKALTVLKEDLLSNLPPAFHVMLKPRGPICNLDCTYCFYLSKKELYGEGTSFHMPDDVLEEFTRQYIEAHRVDEVTFGWQGGEPTLMGLEFFRRAVELQAKYRRPGMSIKNSFQTNGVLLDDEWCRFFKEHGFLVGLSMDGPKELHDAYRVDKGGKPTFEKVYRSLKLLQRHGVEFNILCVVNRINADYPLRVYRFFKNEGIRFIQFIPAVERATDGDVTEWTVRPEQWGEFLCAIFDEWVRSDVGKIFVQQFEVALEAWLGFEPSLCAHAETCGNCLAMEHNGDLFSCDHFVYPEFYLGNIMETPLAQLVASPFQRKFGLDKRDKLPRYCRECPFLFACNGGCPKDRFAKTPEGEGGLNYLCVGYKRFFSHIDPYMRLMANLLRQGQPAWIVTEILRQKEKDEGLDFRLGNCIVIQDDFGRAGARPSKYHQLSRQQKRKVGPNDPCPCGSERKFKKCCMGKL
ncbi:MAG: anaerobic sulfatase maturase [Armatimonadota bacterium]|nr:anaerobic sulfatase maturase [Armatimonadota bacterium]MDW8143600.1 anaerobic sulfatase maturase [Armatimonadota bacterium]